MSPNSRHAVFCCLVCVDVDGRCCSARLYAHHTVATESDSSQKLHPWVISFEPSPDHRLSHSFRIIYAACSKTYGHYCILLGRLILLAHSLLWALTWRAAFTLHCLHCACFQSDRLTCERSAAAAPTVYEVTVSLSLGLRPAWPWTISNSVKAWLSLIWLGCGVRPLRMLPLLRVRPSDPRPPGSRTRPSGPPSLSDRAASFWFPVSSIP